MDYNQIKSESYRKVHDELHGAVKQGFFLSVKAMRGNVKKLSHSINVLSNGVMFAASVEEVEKVNNRIAELTGRRDAYKERIDMIAK